MSAVAAITDANPSVEVMEARVARFSALRTTDHYVDAGIPGCERSTYRVLGTVPGAPLEAEAFHMNLVRCAPGKGARCLRRQSWDTISVPPGMSRGFRNVGDGDAWLMGIAGGHDPGRINWPEPVRAAARAAGVELPSAP